MSTNGSNSAIAETTRDELVAVHEGHAPYHQDLRAELGDLSMAAAGIRDTQKEIETDKANFAFLQEVSEILPKAEDGEFHLDGADIQYTARQIQANTLWDWGLTNHGWGYEPWYIVGRQVDPDQENTVNLVLLSAEGEEYHTVRRSVRFAKVRADDLAIRDQLALDIENDEFTNDEVQDMVDRTSGKMILGAKTRGNILFEPQYRGDSSIKNVMKRGVRIHPGSLDDFYEEIPSSLMEQLHVSTTVAKLATVFGVEEKLRAILEVAPDKETRKPELEAVLAQNRSLKDALVKALAGTGLLSRKKASKLVQKEFPDLK